MQIQNLYQLMKNYELLKGKKIAVIFIKKRIYFFIFFSKINEAGLSNINLQLQIKNLKE
jgi:hypothetical protein